MGIVVWVPLTFHTPTRTIPTTNNFPHISQEDVFCDSFVGIFVTLSCSQSTFFSNPFLFKHVLLKTNSKLLEFG